MHPDFVFWVLFSNVIPKLNCQWNSKS